MVSHIPETTRRRGIGPATDSPGTSLPDPVTAAAAVVPETARALTSPPEQPEQPASRENIRPRSRFSRRVPRLSQRCGDGLVVLTVCLLAGLSRPWLTALGVVLVLQLVPGFYRFRLRLSLLDELPRLLPVAALSTFLVTDIVNPISTADAAVVTALVTGGLVGSWGVLAATARFRRTRHPATLERTLLLGSAETTRELAGYLRQHPGYGLLPVVLADREIEPGAEGDGLGVDRLDDNLGELIRRHRVSVVIVAFSRYSDEHLLRVLRSCVREDAEFYIVPRLADQRGDHTTELLGALALRHIPRAAHRSLGWHFKRPFDVLVSGAALVLLSPLLLALALAVKLDCRSAPVLFRQERIGLDGRPFDVLKFRSLLPVDRAESDSHWNIAGDKRLTRLGAVMRRYSLDELPQVHNVFRGDMSLVGPRPERPFFVDKFAQQYPDYVDRHRVPVGLTGWAAINGLRGDTSIRERVLYDNWYIENWSPWLDIKVMVLTVRAVVGGSGG